MDRLERATDRRTVLRLLGTGSALALAGCSADGGDGDGGTPTPADTVPDAYRTATSLGGQERDPDNVSAKANVDYQAEPKDGEQCSGCSLYIPDKNDDGMGACAIVEGTIDPAGWCVSYTAYEGDGDAVEAVSVPADASCGVCKMQPAKFPDWNAQAAHEDGTRAFFCSAGCAVAYHVAPDRFAETDAAVAGLWVTDVETRALIDGTTAFYALETAADRLDDPMMVNPAPFASREDAVAYVDAVEYLTTDDIVTLSAFDVDLATQYRGRFFE